MARDREHEQATAVRAVRMAARACRAVRERLVAGAAITKQDRTPVTVADFAAQAIVCRHLLEHFPHDPVVGEESSAQLRPADHADARLLVVQHVSCEFNQMLPEEDVLAWIDRGAKPEPDFAGRYWTIDPIDGTKGFLRGDQYAIALGLVEEGRVVVGALACPCLPSDTDVVGVLLTAVRGGGTYELPLWDEAVTAGRPVRVDQVRQAREARFCESLESVHSRQDVSAAIAARLGITAPPLRMDSQAKYASVARGRASVYLKFPPQADRLENIWDHAAGNIVVQEAGGRVTDMQGAALDFSLGRGLRVGKGIVASNGWIHEAVLDAIAGR